MRVQIDLRVDLALCRHRITELVQQSTLELPRLDLEFGPRSAIDAAYRYAGMTDAVAELRREVRLNLLTAEILDPRPDASNPNLGTRRGDALRPLAHAHGL